jgi:hypothetical protein
MRLTGEPNAPATVRIATPVAGAIISFAKRRF